MKYLILPGSEVYATEYDKLIEQARIKLETARFRRDLLHNYIPTEQLQKDFEIVDSDYDKYFSDPDFTDANLTKLMQLYGINEIGELHDTIRNQLKYQQEHPEETLTSRVEAAMKKEVVQKKAVEQNKVAPTSSDKATPGKKEVVAPTQKRMTRVERGIQNGIYTKPSTTTASEKPKVPPTPPVKEVVAPTQKRMTRVERGIQNGIYTKPSTTTASEKPKAPPTPSVQESEKPKTYPTPAVQGSAKPKTYPTPAASGGNPTRAKGNHYIADSSPMPGANLPFSTKKTRFQKFIDFLKKKLDNLAKRFTKTPAIEKVGPAPRESLKRVEQTDPTNATSINNFENNPITIPIEPEIYLGNERDGTPIIAGGVNGAIRKMIESRRVPHIEGNNFYHYMIQHSKDPDKPDTLSFVKEDITPILENPAQAYADTLNGIKSDRTMCDQVISHISDKVDKTSRIRLENLTAAPNKRQKMTIAPVSRENADTYIKNVLLLKNAVTPREIAYIYTRTKPESIDKAFEGTFGSNVTFWKNTLRRSCNMEHPTEECAHPLLERVSSTSPQTQSNPLVTPASEIRETSAPSRYPSFAESYNASHPSRKTNPYVRKLTPEEVAHRRENDGKEP